MARIKQGILIIVGCLVSMLANPLILAADDHFTAKSPDFQAAETVLAARFVEEAEEEDTTPATAEPTVYATALRGSVAWAKQAVTPEKAPEPIATRNYTVTIQLASAAEYIAVSSAPSYSDIYRFGKLVFAHNTMDLFGTLANLGVGETINLTEGGVTRPYRVSAVQYYNNTEQGLDGDPMMVTKLVQGAMGHDAALMTCAGVMYGDGNASQRLVVFIDAL